MLTNTFHSVWNVFQTIAYNHDDCITIIVFAKEIDKFAFQSLLETCPPQYGYVADLTNIGQFSARSNCWASKQQEELVNSVKYGAVFVCLMQDQEGSYREHIMPRLQNVNYLLLFSGG